jgi:hypothetical protein
VAVWIVTASGGVQRDEGQPDSAQGFFRMETRQPLCSSKDGELLLVGGGLRDGWAWTTKREREGGALAPKPQRGNVPLKVIHLVLLEQTLDAAGERRHVLSLLVHHFSQVNLNAAFDHDAAGREVVLRLQTYFK